MLSSLLLKNLPYKHRKRTTNGETLISTSSSHHSSLRPKVAGATSEKHLLGQTSTPDYQVNSPPVGIIRGTAPSNRPLQGFFFFFLEVHLKSFWDYQVLKHLLEQRDARFKVYNLGVFSLKVRLLLATRVVQP